MGEPRLFELEDFLRAAGPALRPGGTTLTALALEHCRLPEGALVADVGCGRGASLALLEGKGFRAVGIDPSAALLSQAPREAPGARLALGRAEALPFKPGRFAAAFCECVLSLTADPLRALREIRRVLAVGGFLALSDLYLRDPQAGGAEPPPGCASGTVSRQTLEERLRQAGFAVLVFVDHSRLLAELAGRLLFAGLSIKDLGLGGPCRGRPGYCLCIAQRED
ncbi:Demethylrebeccamycin-D-glucose O-methyltransferase [Fundidesulfovibrio magnetotacticus]|uniref:Demethylrebeccamycin-D-glucose O-methyltransferase n=1 Tax=Fundidesulfovibrio magnetotacticus TaxID=2730080 RepID=A0A6V8LKH4_9BACT|nr:class I SAM-dependent methyltransferase [Fundidesulfovibrio magnetotacticus]GFK92184.1 Demethylrebeccamycin-D-glucose O-methyltransferase [Fundidesulfovibrio magnetotacticus]